MSNYTGIQNSVPFGTSTPSIYSVLAATRTVNGTGGIMRRLSILEKESNVSCFECIEQKKLTRRNQAIGDLSKYDSLVVDYWQK